MRPLRRNLFITAGIAALFSPALADTQSKPASDLPTSIIVHSVAGKSTVLPVDSKKASQLLSNPHTKPLPGDVVVFVVKGKAYMLEDHQLPNGKMFVNSLVAEYPSYDAPEGGD
ncbi:MAG TPA: hypothetical protein VM689_16980 [Aliidongia sp.]|nr:hypothetical protein [Aliidongia sp.]